jgi:hypothetical protein
MKNFTLALSFLLISAWASGQQPLITPVWNHSVYGTADWSSGIPSGGAIPEWMGGTSERGMAYHDAKLYIVSRKFIVPVLVVLDAATGEHLYSAAIDTSVVKGGTIPVNDIAITPSGQILVANMSAATHTVPYKVYLLEAVGEERFDATVLLEWMSQDTIDGVEQPNHRIGDGFAFYGDISDTEDGFIIVGDATSTVEQTVFRWHVHAGELNEEPEKIIVSEVYPAPAAEDAVPKFGITPRIHPVSEEMFWADGHSTMPALYNMDGDMLSGFTGEAKPQMAGISGVKFFSFRGADYVLAPTSNHIPPTGTPPSAFQLFLIPEEGAEEADSIAIFPERGLGSNSNASYAAPMAVDVQEDHVMMYVMSPNNGIAAFRLTDEETVSAPVLGVSPKDILVYPNPASDRIFVNVDKPTQVAIYNLAGVMVKSRLLESKNDYIEVHDLVPGMYLVRSQMSNEFAKKLIVR